MQTWFRQIEVRAVGSAFARILPLLISYCLASAGCWFGRQIKVRAVGIEPTTHGLKDRCSTSELRPHALQGIILQSLLSRGIGLYVPGAPPRPILGLGRSHGAIPGKENLLMSTYRDARQAERSSVSMTSCRTISHEIRPEVEPVLPVA